jgi:heme A synthase
MGVARQSIVPGCLQSYVLSLTLHHVLAVGGGCRVRVLEGERAARRTGVMQLVTVNTVASVGLLDVGTQLALHGGLEGPAGLCYALSAVFGVFVALGLKRVQRLDKFEKEIRG